MSAQRVPEDGNLPQALRKLGEAISALIDPKPVTVHREGGATSIEWLDSLYVQLVEAVPGEKKHRTGVSTSQPPMWLEASDKLRKIDRKVTTWEPHWPLPLPSQWPWAYDDNYPTIQRLQIIENRSWSPQDCTVIDVYTTTIEKWCTDIRDILSPEPVIYLMAPAPAKGAAACTACGTDYVWRPDPSDNNRKKRQPALKVTKDGCHCQKCGARWEPGVLRLLAAALGYPLPAGVLE